MFFSIVLSFVCYGISKAVNSHMPCVMARDASIISHMHLSRKSTVAAHNKPQADSETSNYTVGLLSFRVLNTKASRESVCV